MYRILSLKRNELHRSNGFSGATCERGGEKGYNLHMVLALIAMRLLEVMFFFGLAGSAVVVLISFVEDGRELFGKDEPPESRA
jgi:hypothetical protein